MGLQYVVARRVFDFDKDKNVKYVAKSVGLDELGADKLYVKVSRVLGIHRKTMDLVAIDLIDIMSEETGDGKTVCLGDPGLFRLSSVGKCADTWEGVAANNVARKRIPFFPGKVFSAMLDKANVTRMAMPDTGYTGGSQGNEGKPKNPDISGGGEEEDPLGQSRIL